MSEKIDLFYSLTVAQIGFGEKRHAQKVMKELGISYEKAIPQSLFDGWEFIGCTNIPNELPGYLTKKVRK